MKTTMKILFLGFLSVALGACGGNDGEEGEEVLIEDGNLVLQASTDTIRNSRFEEVAFTVAYHGTDVTAGAKIKENITGEFVKGAAFSPEKVGTFEFVASYEGKVSKPVKVTVVKDILFRKHLLMQEFTSIGCGNCPAMVNNIDYYRSLYPERIDVLAYHGTMQEDMPDPMRVHAYMGPLTTRFNLPGYPSAVLDQTRVWSGNEVTADMDVKSRIDLPGTVGIAMETALNGRNLDITVKVKATEKFTHPCRVAVVMIENKLYYKQLEYYMDGGKKERWIEDWENNHVVRYYLTDIWGDKLELGAIERGKEWQKSYTYSFPDNATIPEVIDQRNPENMEVVVYVTDASTDQVLNSRTVKVGGKVDYEYEK